MALLSISEACRKAGISKPTMYNNYIKNGKISVGQDNAGKRGIDPSELLRVFGELKGDPAPIAVPAPSERDDELVAILRDQLAKAEARATAAEARADQYYKDLIATQNRLLPEPEKKGFFARLFGG